MINLYTTRTMMAALKKRFPPRTFLRKLVFKAGAGEGKTFSTPEVDVDIVKGKRTLAPYVSPKHEGVLIEKTGYETRSFKPGYVKPKIVATAEEMFDRQPGNVIYDDNGTADQVAAQQVLEELGKLDDSIARREEQMTAEALQTGQVVISGQGIDRVVDYHMDGTQLPTLIGTARWSEHATATPLDDLKLWQLQRSQDSGKPTTHAIMGHQAYENFMKCEQIIGTDGAGKNLFNMDRIRIGEIVPKNLGDGVMYKGYLSELNLEIFVYHEWYVSETDGQEYPMVKDDKVILLSDQARAEFVYGAIQDLKATFKTSRFAKSWEKEDPSVRYVLVQSAPLPILTEIDAYACATVL